MAIAAVANLVGAFVTTAVAKTVGSGVLDTNLVTTKTVLAALFGAIAWNLATWWLGLPFNSSHALSGAWWERESPSPGSATSSGTTWRTR